MPFSRDLHGRNNGLDGRPSRALRIGRFEYSLVANAGDVNHSFRHRRRIRVYIKVLYVYYLLI